MAVLVTALGATGMIVAAKRVVRAVGRVPGVADVLSDPSPNMENFLLVGSDSRANIDPNSPDFGGIGTEDEVTGSRSDTIMVLRLDKRGGPASLLSIPRDLWVSVPGHEGKRRINSAFNDGPAVLVQTVQQALMLPIHHYVEVDFSGFKDLVDSVGGVVVCFQYPTRDLHTGLDVPVPGCFLLDGVQALAYARSRYYEQFRDNDWQRDGTADLGRSTRQRDFVNRAVQAALDEVKANPFSAGRMVSSIGAALRIDDQLDPIRTGSSLRSALGTGLVTYALPVVGTTIDDKSVLLLADDANSVLDFFRGAGPAPESDG